MSKRLLLRSPHRLAGACSLDRDSSRADTPLDQASHASRAFHLFRFAARSGLGLAFLVFALVGGSSTAAAGTFRLEVLQSEAFPSDTEVRVPVVVTNGASVSSWQARFLFDSTYLTLQDVEFDGTVSEILSPTVTIDQGTDVTVSYGSPLKEGTQQLVAYLRFAVDRSTPPPDPNDSVATEIAPGGVDTTPLLFELTDGSTVTPAAGPGMATIYFGVVLQVGEVSGSYWDALFDSSPIVVPLRGWSSDPIGQYMTSGHEWIDLFNVELETDPIGDPTVVEDLGSGATTSVTFEPADSEGPARWIVRIDLEPGVQIPALNGEVLTYLRLTPLTPSAGLFDLQLLPDFSEEPSGTIGNLLAGSVELADEFLRGDANFDGVIDIADITRVLGYMFSGTPIPCPKTADLNDDGIIDPADAFYLLAFRFSAGPMPASPFPQAGIDPTEDSLPCLIP